MNKIPKLKDYFSCQVNQGCLERGRVLDGLELSHELGCREHADKLLEYGKMMLITLGNEHVDHLDGDIVLAVAHFLEVDGVRKLANDNRGL